MRKILCWAVLLLFTVVYALSSSTDFMKSVTRKRYAMYSPFGSDKYKYGDLYGLSYLQPFKIPQDGGGVEGKTPDGEAEAPAYCGKSGRKRDIDLYSICDSYLFLFVKSNQEFCRGNKYSYKRSIDYGHLNVHLDKSKINVLLIERTERSVREALRDMTLETSLLPADQEELVITPNRAPTNFRLNKEINYNLEFNLFDYKFLTPVKEFKAWLNYKVFGRTDPMVRVSQDNSRLYFSETMDTSGYTSSVVPLSDAVIDTCVSNLNKLYAHYKAMGFDYIYFCTIPNPCTMLEKEHIQYNNFIPRLQNNPALKVPVIDMYSLFAEDPQNIYSRSDTHWNRNGYSRWLQKFNNVLDTIPGK